MLARLDQLPRLDTDILAAAAVVGEEPVAPLLARVCAVPVEEVINALDLGVRAGVLVEVPNEPGRYSFAHGLMRECLYDSLTAARRARLHQAVLHQLVQLYGAETHEHVSELAHHALAALPYEPADEAIARASAAAARAFQSLAFEEAARIYNRALRTLEQWGGTDERRFEALTGLGHALLRSGETVAARKAFERAVQVAQASRWTDRLAEATLGVAETSEFGLVDHRAIELLEQALKRLGDSNVKLRVQLMARLVMLLQFAPEEEERRDDLSLEAVSVARTLGEPQTLAFALHARLTAAWEPETLEERRRWGAEIVKLGRRGKDPERTLWGHEWLWT